MNNNNNYSYTYICEIFYRLQLLHIRGYILYGLNEMKLNDEHKHLYYYYYY